MANEDQHFVTGPGHSFRNPYWMAMKGYAYEEVVHHLVKGLRAELGKGNGAAGLEDLARSVGVHACGTDRRLFDGIGAVDVQNTLNQHCALQNPTAHWEARTVQRAFNLQTVGRGAAVSLRELYKDYCMEMVDTLFFSRVENDLPFTSANERLDWAEAIRASVSNRLDQEDSDVIDSLCSDPSGKHVAKRRRIRKVTTADLLGELVPLGSGVSL